MFFFKLYSDHRDLHVLTHSFPTRRASDIVDQLEGPDVEGAGTLFIPSSKTDQEGEGAYAYLSPETMAAIGRWREAARIESGPLFRRVETHFDGSIASVGRSALHPNSITLIYKRLIREIGRAHV